MVKQDNKTAGQPLGPLPVIEKEVDSYFIFYASYYTVISNPPKVEGSTSKVDIALYDKNENFIGQIGFYDSEVVPTNGYSGSNPNYIVTINFHISKFNDIINILRNEKLIHIHLDLNTLDGSITARK